MPSDDKKTGYQQLGLDASKTSENTQKASEAVKNLPEAKAQSGEVKK